MAPRKGRWQMIVKDSVGEQGVFRAGKGEVLAYSFFEGQIGPAMSFAEYVSQPGMYSEYHRHEGSGSILYVLSGRAEYFQEGERCILEGGDTTLLKSGQAHAIRNIGDEALGVLEFLYLEVPGGDVDLRSTITNLPFPDEISDWQ
jgi:quercetin dioxygenase-like cupin family protein